MQIACVVTCVADAVAVVSIDFDNHCVTMERRVETR